MRGDDILSHSVQTSEKRYTTFRLVYTHLGKITAAGTEIGTIGKKPV